MNARSILALAKGIEADQNEGSDYDALYFGLQDLIEMLEDLVSKTTHRTARVRGHADDAFSKTREMFGRVKKKKRRKSKKVKVLDEMAKKAWNKYKKGSGKKTYIQIRAQVSRSQAYKKKVKNL